MFTRIFLVENTKLLKRPLPWIVIGITIAVAILTYGINLLLIETDAMGMATPAELTDQMAASLLWPGALYQSLSLSAGASLGGLIVVILVGAATAQEYTWGTLQQWLGRGVSRPSFLSAKFLAFVLPIALLVLLPFLATMAISGVYTVIETGNLAASEVAWGELALDTVATIYSLLPYAALTFLLAILTRSTVAAVGGGIAYAVMLEGLVIQLANLFSETIARLSLYLPGGLARSLLGSQGAVQIGMDGSPMAGPELLDPVVAGVGIALYAILFLALSAWIFRRQDLGG